MNPGNTGNTGLCAGCRHARTVESARGSAFLLCLRSERDARYSKYPSLPVFECAGHETMDAGRFPATRGSAVLGVRSNDASIRERALSVIAESYWKPVYKYIRMRWNKSHDDAADLTQGFFERAIEKSYLAAYDPAKGRFRTFLRTCLDGFLANEHAAAKTQKRGGDFTFVSFDFQDAENELAIAGRSGSSGPGSSGPGSSGPGSSGPGGFASAAAAGYAEAPDAAFEREWLRALFQAAIEELRRRLDERGRTTAFRAFERYDLAGDDQSALTPRITYEDLGRELGIPATSVTNALSSCRRELREILMEKLRELTASDEEFRLEMRGLFGARSR